MCRRFYPLRRRACYVVSTFSVPTCAATYTIWYLVLGFVLCIERIEYLIRCARSSGNVPLKVFNPRLLEPSAREI